MLRTFGVQPAVLFGKLAYFRAIYPTRMKIWIRGFSTPICFFMHFFPSPPTSDIGSSYARVAI